MGEVTHGSGCKSTARAIAKRGAWNVICVGAPFKRSRDPRIDPKPGDGIEREFKTAPHGVVLREVTRTQGGFVFFRRDNGFTAKNEIVSLTQWRKWAGKAQVFEYAD